MKEDGFVCAANVTHTPRNTKVIYLCSLYGQPALFERRLLGTKQKKHRAPDAQAHK
jgi:hypothetical protein